MKISELPTPRLRARAMDLYIKDEDYSPIKDEDLLLAFDWTEGTEGSEFWWCCYKGNWDKAKELQPSLFKPMDGKPHIKLVSKTSLSYRSNLEDSTTWGVDVANSSLFKYEDVRSVYIYTDTVNPDFYPTIKEAVEALYSFKRGDANEG